MKNLKLFVILFIISIPQLAFSLENREFLTWHGKDVDEINRLEDLLSKKLESDTSIAEVRELFNQYKTPLNKKCTPFAYHLKETLLLAEQLASGKIPEETVNDISLEIRNRLNTIYHEFWLKFAPQIEEELLKNLHKIALEQKSSYSRMEAVTAIEIIGRKSSLETLKKALNDMDDLVRKYAKEAIVDIENNTLYTTSYKEYLEHQ